MRPSFVFLLLLMVLAFVDLSLVLVEQGRENQFNQERSDGLTQGLGLTDLNLSTEARYTRHLSITEHTVAFMDHPGAMDHFPSGSFYGCKQ